MTASKEYVAKGRTKTTREPNGRGSIVRDKATGGWVGYVTVGYDPQTGKPVRPKRRGKTKKIVQEKLDVLLKQRSEGVVLKSGAHGTTVEGYFTLFLAGKGAGTQANYGPVINRWVIPHMGTFPIRSVNAAHLEDLFTAMYAAGKNKGGVDAAARVIKSALNTAVRHRVIVRSPMLDVKMPDPPTAVQSRELPSRSLSAEEAGKVLTDLRGRDLSGEARWALAILVGSRQGETLALEWSAVHWAKSEIVVRQQLKFGKAVHGCGLGVAMTEDASGHLVEVPMKESAKARLYYPCGKFGGVRCPQRRPVKKDQPIGLHLVDYLKSGWSERYVAVPVQIIDSLLTLKEQQEKARAEMGDKWVGFVDPVTGRTVDLIFTGPTGAPIHAELDSTRWKATLAGLGLAPARVHDARHTGATLALQAGTHPQVIMQRFGWTDPKLLDRYQHRVPEQHQAAAKATADLVYGTEDKAAEKTAEEKAARKKAKKRAKKKMKAARE